MLRAFAPRAAERRGHSANRACTIGSANADEVAALSLATIAFGVDFGAKRANQLAA